MIKEDLRLYISIVYFRDLEVEKLLIQLINSNLKTKPSKNHSKYKKNNSGERMCNRNSRRRKRYNPGQKEPDI